MGDTWGRAGPRGGPGGGARGLDEEDVGSHPRPRFLGPLGVGAPWEPGKDGGVPCAGVGVRGASLARPEYIDWDASPGSRSARVGKLGSAQVLCSYIPGPGAGKRVAAGAGAGWGLHSNGLRSPHSLAPVDPGRGREQSARGAVGRGKSRSPWARGTGARGPPRDPAAAWPGSGIYPRTRSPLRPCPDKRWAPSPWEPRVSRCRRVCQKGSLRESVTGLP